MKKRVFATWIALVLTVGVITSGFTFYNFVSKTIYEESTSHLVEIFHQANQTLYNLVSVNWRNIQMWSPYLKMAKSEEEIVAYVNQGKEEGNFTDFFFISRDGEYLSMDGQRGYLDLRSRLSSLMIDRQPVVANSVVPDKPEIMVFAVPVDKSRFRDFDYEAIAITYNNTDLVEALEISAFDGQASTYAVLPDGRIVVDNGSPDMKNVHNVLALLEKSILVDEEKLESLRTDFAEGRSGNLVFDVDGRRYYLIYEPADFQDWTVLGIVPTEVVNASMNKLQYATIIVVGGIVIVLAFVVLQFIVLQNRQKLKQKDAQLLVRDELFSKLSVNVDDVFLMVDAKSLQVEYVSPNIEKLVGISEETILRDIHVLDRLVRVNESVHILDQMSEIPPGGQSEWDREYTHQRTGEVRWFRVVVFCTDIQGEKKYVMDLSDRTEDKLINQKLEDAVRTAENANRAKTIFLNSMSHDIRTPMNAIIGFTNIAMKQNPEPEIKSCLKKIGESSEHLLTLINDVLDISRIESGNIQFAPLPVDIRIVSDMVVSIMYGFLANRNLTFLTELGDTATPYVLADAVRIREILVNILGNAVKFTEDGGSITFEISYMPGPDEQHMTVCYRITDTGVGMSEEYVQHIFDEFSQEENSARTQYKGSGLGMTITKRYVDMMGGTIRVESQKGAGSTFVVEIPMEVIDESRVQKQDYADADVDLEGVKVLLAEDNELNAEIAMVLLEELGMEVTRAENGREAVRIFSESPVDFFDVILMDIMMPEMNGYEATEAIRALPERPDAVRVPIIAMTANAFAEDVQASLDAGMNGHLSKPIVMEDVVKAIAKAKACNAQTD